MARRSGYDEMVISSALVGRHQGLELVGLHQVGQRFVVEVDDRDEGMFQDDLVEQSLSRSYYYTWRRRLAQIAAAIKIASEGVSWDGLQFAKCKGMKLVAVLPS